MKKYFVLFVALISASVTYSIIKSNDKQDVDLLNINIEALTQGESDVIDCPRPSRVKCVIVNKRTFGEIKF